MFDACKTVQKALSKLLDRSSPFTTKAVQSQKSEKKKLISFFHSLGLRFFQFKPEGFAHDFTIASVTEIKIFSLASLYSLQYLPCDPPLIPGFPAFQKLNPKPWNSRLIPQGLDHLEIWGTNPQICFSVIGLSQKGNYASRFVHLDTLPRMALFS